MDRIQEYYKQSLLDDLCADYKNKWRAAHGNKEELLRLSLCQQALPHVCTYAYQGKGITKDYVKENFADYINGYKVYDADGVNGYSYGLFVDYDYDNDLTVDIDVASIMWTVGASVVVPETKATTIYISNRSNIHLVCEGYNSVRIYLFDKSKVTLEDVDEDSNIIIYKYSDDATVEIGKYCLSHKVREFSKELKL